MEKSTKEIVFVRLRDPAAILPAESANCTQSRSYLAIPLGDLILKFKHGGEV
jgi:hypothetical protein